jgi:transcriptional regulator with XRE-family HTH domain
MADGDVKVLFGRRVRQLRKEKGVSQEAFAHQIKIDRSYFGSIERGERNVSLENICLIAKGLGVPPAQLLVFDALPASEPEGDAVESRSTESPSAGTESNAGRSTARPGRANKSRRS